jgi:hypothetical protein
VRQLAADDVVHLGPGHFAAPLEEAALLVPLYIEVEQIGTLLLGRPVNGIQYAPEDVELLLYPADQIADALYTHLRNTAHLEKVEQVARESPPPSAALSRIPEDTVDLALRNLFDYAYLADSPLAELAIVRRQLAGDRKTHVERGKTIQTILVEALNQLRPGPEVPRERVPREWYPYVILHDAYVTGIQNRDIMKRLYISEGTFNRTRRSAIRSLARVLAETEHPV